ncbi:hypothetical protein [Chitinophaga sp. MM2321]|uniref:hypothetical protein n=1 Tax=Chitinophaga sp. MM2321 TaxID=3137178 RepID=UPI0032D58E0A
MEKLLHPLLSHAPGKPIDISVVTDLISWGTGIMLIFAAYPLLMQGLKNLLVLLYKFFIQYQF